MLKFMYFDIDSEEKIYPSGIRFFATVVNNLNKKDFFQGCKLSCKFSFLVSSNPVTSLILSYMKDQYRTLHTSWPNCLHYFLLSENV